MRPLIVLAFALLSTAPDARSKSAKYQFQKANPCPSTGAHAGRCPGYVIDHIVPLCAGGADHRANMQWQTIRDAKAKDRDEARECAARRRTRRRDNSE